MLGLNSSSQLHCNTQQHYSPKQVIHGAGVLLAGLQTRRALAARPQNKSLMRFAKAGESLIALEVEVPGRGVKSWLFSTAQTVGPSLVKSVEGCRSHGSPCRDPGFNSPLDYLSSPRWRLSGASACWIRLRLCKGESEHLSSRINHQEILFAFRPLNSTLCADTHSNPLILVCRSNRLRERALHHPREGRGGRAAERGRERWRTELWAISWEQRWSQCHG